MSSERRQKWKELEKSKRNGMEERGEQRANGEGRDCRKFQFAEGDRTARDGIARWHAEFVTALFTLRVRGKNRNHRVARYKIRLSTVLDAHTYISVNQVSVDFRYAESKLRYIVSEFQRCSWISTRFLSVSLPLSRCSPLSHTLVFAFPFHAIDFPFAKRKNVSSATPFRHTGLGRREWERQRVWRRNWILPRYAGMMICACKSVYDDCNGPW